LKTKLHVENLPARETDERVRFLFSPCGDIAFEPPHTDKRLLTILVVDDNPDDLILIERAFRAIGVKDSIQTVRSASEAIAYIKGEGKFSDRKAYQYPAFVMTDLNMPGGDGFAVLEYLQDHPECPIVPTVVFSSSTQPDHIGKCYRLGASSYHVKQGSTDELRHQLKIVHDFWMTCERPEVSGASGRVRAESKGIARESCSVLTH
jgi:CheY-like chemotaxis protein